MKYQDSDAIIHQKSEIQQFRDQISITSFDSNPEITFSINKSPKPNHQQSQSVFWSNFHRILRLKPRNYVSYREISQNRTKPKSPTILIRNLIILWSNFNQDLLIQTRNYIPYKQSIRNNQSRYPPTKKHINPSTQNPITLSHETNQ